MVIDRWLRRQLLPWVSSPLLPYFLTLVTILDQLVLEEFNCRTFSMIILIAGTSRSPEEIDDALTWLVNLFDSRKSQNTFPRFFSEFLMDPARARSLWVNHQMYTSLTMQLLKILSDK